MLYRETVSAELLALLESLMTIRSFGTLRLVGGTALGLQIGHRNSVDIDFLANTILMSTSILSHHHIIKSSHHSKNQKS